MKRSAVLLLLALTIVPLQHQTASAGLFGADKGRKKIGEILKSPALSRTNIGIKAVSLSTGKTLVQENSGKLFMPASNVKMVTAYCALKTLTPQYTFPTDFLTDTLVDTSTVHHLYVRGCGDPSVTLADINQQAMTLSGMIGRITGDIIIDNTYFDGLRFGQGWMWDEGIVPWNAPITPYAAQGNCIDVYVRPAAQPGCAAAVRTVPGTGYAIIIASVTTSAAPGEITIQREEDVDRDRFIVTGTIAAGSPEKKWRCTVSRPGLYAATLFKELLTRYGVTFKGNVYESASPLQTVCIARYESKSLADTVRTFLKDSDNLSGECLLKTLGAATSLPPGDAAKGIAAVERTLGSLGITRDTYRLVDGSGLSTYNLLSPDIIVRLLEETYKEFSFFPEFMDALAVAGADGTLKNRFNEPPLVRRVRAKTGTMSGVSCVSGYLKTRKGDLIAVSIMMNGFTGPAKPFQDAQDEIIKVLWEQY